MEIRTITFLFFIIAVCSLIYKIYRNYLSYWNNRKVPSVRTFQKFFDVLFLYKKCPAIAFNEIYEDRNTRNEPVVGIHIFHRPALVIKDPELIKKVLIKDFNYFQDRFTTADIHRDLLGSNNLFLQKNPRWKKMRTNLTPVFTSGKIKQMFSLANDIGKELDRHILALTENSPNESDQEVKGIAQLFTIDVIASIAFGIDANSMSNPKADFLKHGREIFNFTRWRSFEFSSLFFLPDIVSFLNVKVFTEKSTHFLKSSFRHIMQEREKSNMQRNDLIEALLQIRKQQKFEKDQNKILDETSLIAQAATFFIAGYETSSTTISFALWQLTLNPEIQDRLRLEIKNVLEKSNGKLTYDLIHNMEYLNMVVQETLRLYPVLPFLDRIYKDPGGKDYTLEPFCKGSIKSGTPIHIPIYSIQRDENYFENPNKFDPERFTINNKKKIVPYSFMPFGVGPRNCIGERFGLLQTKIGLLYFLKSHKLEISERTLKETKLNNKALLLQLKDGIYAKLVRDPLVI
ncbi:cytochrome P450 6g1-like isoform X1 [Condylostylus longicornis]|uniref:cytochrome P450 6g1-like isoform X1 n=1 Tax=Condylostylus longicornis TaxID=2530218 RepID=UPI00244DA89F|nr:cytochrome P450 6g1-like isoform X1 [Condylostylus longicornis]